MRIIRVTGCHDCDKKKESRAGWKCPILNIMVTKYFRDESLPDNCPLEKEIGVILPDGAIGSGKAKTNMEGFPLESKK